MSQEEETPPKTVVAGVDRKRNRGLKSSYLVATKQKKGRGGREEKTREPEESRERQGGSGEAPRSIKVET